ncbi:MAG TPA: hypothetical protein VIL37_00005 [Natronosporangium sp.]
MSEQRVRAGLPEDLELMPPGADLAALLDSIDRNALSVPTGCAWRGRATGWRRMCRPGCWKTSTR